MLPSMIPQQDKKLEGKERENPGSPKSTNSEKSACTYPLMSGPLRRLILGLYGSPVPPLSRFRLGDDALSRLELYDAALSRL